MARRAAAFLVLFVLFVAACAGDDGDGDGEAGTGSTASAPSESTGSTTSVPGVDGPVTANDLCLGAAAYDPGRTVETTALVEVSGIATSRQNPNLIWAHNDSGGGPDVWAMGSDGSGDRKFTLTEAEAFDWEDMTLGPGPEPDLDYLYLGDIGDNLGARDELTIYRVTEPAVDESSTGGELTDVEGFTVSYEDGPRDAEALLSDPVTGDLFVVNKNVALGPIAVYRIPADTPAGDRVVMERASELSIPGMQFVTGGDISPDGSLIALRTYDEVLLWDRRPDQTVPEALSGQPCSAPQADEGQGEAVAFGADGRSYVTISEGANPPVNWFRLP
jgi:hypothetical protein